MTPLQALIEAAEECSEVACAETCDHIRERDTIHTSECIHAKNAILAAQAYEQAIREQLEATELWEPDAFIAGMMLQSDGKESFRYRQYVKLGDFAKLRDLMKSEVG